VADERLLAEADEHLRCMRVADALRLFNLAEQANHDPDACAGGRWTCHMLSGNFELAWRESDAITARANPDPNRFWDGEPFAGRSVLVRCLHGLGDTIQFIRYVPLMREKARGVALEVQPSLKLLLKESRIADEVFTWGEREPHWDQQMEVVELPRIFRTTLDSIPNQVPYLDVPSVLSISRDDGLRPVRVGIVWASSSFNPARSVPLERFASIFATPGIRFYSLQAGSERTELQSWSTEIEALYDETACVLATAQALKALDLLITVDTMVAHLAGALARPVWTLLPFECDWRWMLDREDSPWYPTMRLFRQPKPADWDPVIERVQRELDALVAMKTGTMDYQVSGLASGPPLVQGG
jgi:hypothetical protein